MALIYSSESYNIIGTAMEVHKELGKGFLESVYQEALEIELLALNIPYTREANIPINYKNRKLSKYFVADFICYDKIILELKAISEITPEHTAQVFNYLKATGYKLGILINFGALSLQYKRIVL
jgi:GxxExxY protein